MREFDFPKCILFFCLPPEFLPVSAPLIRWCASTLGTALSCSSRALLIRGLYPDWFEGLLIIKCWCRQYGFNLEMPSHRNQKGWDSNPGPPGKKPPLCHRTSLRTFIMQIQINCLLYKIIMHNHTYFSLLRNCKYADNLLCVLAKKKVCMRMQT